MHALLRVRENENVIWLNEDEYANHVSRAVINKVLGKQQDHLLVQMAWPDTSTCVLLECRQDSKCWNLDATMCLQTTVSVQANSKRLKLHCAFHETNVSSLQIGCHLNKFRKTAFSTLNISEQETSLEHRNKWPKQFASFSWSLILNQFSLAQGCPHFFSMHL